MIDNCFIKSVYMEDINVPLSDRPFLNSIYDNLFILYSQNIIDWRLVKAICYVESGYNPLIQNLASGAKGLMQITSIACNDIGCCLWNNLLNAEHNVKVGCEYIKKLKFTYGASYGLVNNTDLLIAYNWGIGNLKEIKANYGVNYFAHLPDETKDYIYKVKKFYSYVGGVL